MTIPSQVRAYFSKIGKKAAGKPKKFSAEEIEKRVARLQEINRKRRAEKVKRQRP